MIKWSISYNIMHEIMMGYTYNGGLSKYISWTYFITRTEHHRYRWINSSLILTNVSCKFQFFFRFAKRL